MQTAFATVAAADVNKMNKNMNSTKRIALCGLLAAMQTVILYFSSIFSVIDLTLAACTVFLTMFTVIEIGGKYPWLIYGVVSVLSLLLLPQKFSAVVYVCFFGWYPIAKAFFERLNTVLSWIAKIASFNACYLLIFEICSRVLMIEDTGILDGKTYYIVMIILGNAAFLALDFMMRLAVTLYKLKLRKQMGIDKLLK